MTATSFRVWLPTHAARARDNWDRSSLPVASGDRNAGKADGAHDAQCAWRIVRCCIPAVSQ
jgi:hypothetical protein